MSSKYYERLPGESNADYADRITSRWRSQERREKRKKMISPLLLGGAGLAAAFMLMGGKAKAATMPTEEWHAGDTMGVDYVKGVPDFAQPGKWPSSQNLDADLTGLSLVQAQMALDGSKDISLILQTAEILERFPIASSRLRQKAEILGRLKAEGHWLMNPVPKTQQRVA